MSARPPGKSVDPRIDDRNVLLKLTVTLACTCLILKRWGTDSMKGDGLNGWGHQGYGVNVHYEFPFFIKKMIPKTGESLKQKETYTSN